MILLDTHAAIWLARDHRRAGPLRTVPRLFLSPASLLEVQFLVDVGRVRMAGDRSPHDLAADFRWRLDEPPAGRWFAQACAFEWTRDPFDRLIAAHARLRGWKLATADDMLLDRLPAADVMPL